MKDEYICYRTQCRYHSGNVSGSDGSCNYFFITGETKTSLGEADITRKCGLYKPGTALRVRAQPVVLRGSSPRREQSSERGDFTTGRSSGRSGMRARTTGRLRA